MFKSENSKITGFTYLRFVLVLIGDLGKEISGMSKVKARQRVALIQGGMSSERQISLSTGQAFAGALDELGYTYQVIDAGPDLPDQLVKLKPDVALLALHGKFAEDGTVQGICEYLRIPYSGSGVLASALCMNKYFTKQVLIFNHIPTPDFELLRFDEKNLDLSQLTKFQYPLVVKPSRDGSSMGISICQSKDTLQEAVFLAGKYDREILVENFIPGMELTVPILKDRALTPIEIVPEQGFYDFRRKYTAGASQYYLPARLDASLLEQVQELALKTHQACQARVYSRVDFRLGPDKVPYVIEINTLPGCTPTSLLPKAAAHEGIRFSDVVRILVEEASLDYREWGA